MSSLQPTLDIATLGFAWAAFLLSLFMLPGIAMMVVGNVRQKQHGAALSIQITLVGWAIFCSFFIGWWLRQLFVPGPGITGGFGDVSRALPWSVAMGSASDGAGFAWLRFALASWMVSALVAASLLERIRTTSVLFLTVVASAVCAPIVAAWTSDAEGWLVRLAGAHDAFGGAAIHALAGGFALGVLHRLGPRASATTAEGHIVEVPASIPWLQALGCFLFIIGLFAFMGSFLQPLASGDSGAYVVVIGAYGTSTSLSLMTTNLILALSAGLLIGSVLGGGRPHKVLAGGVAGIVSVASGADLYHPLQAFLIAGAMTWFAFSVRAHLATRYKIDDALGTVSWHGAAGVGGVIVAGFVLWTFPSTTGADPAMINPFGNAVSALLGFLVFGYVPGYLIARFLDYLDVLRIPLSVEIAGADLMDDLADAQATADAAERERSLVRRGLAGNGES